MLDIENMFKKDKVFCFVERLQPWARTKLYKQKVQDLAAIFTTTKRSLNFGDEVDV